MLELSLHILDIVQNSIEAKATLVEIGISEDILSDKFIITIGDNGTGIKKEILNSVTDPFTTTRTTRKVGMGLPLLKQSAEQAGGKVEVHSETKKGTIIRAEFVHSHIDRPPLGDISGTISLLASGNPEIDFIFRHCKGVDEYVFDTREVKKVLGEVPISELQVKKHLQQMIFENLQEIGAEQ